MNASKRSPRRHGIILAATLFLTLLIPSASADTFIVPDAADWSFNGTPDAIDTRLSDGGIFGVASGSGTVRIGTLASWQSHTFSGISASKICIGNVDDDNWVAVFSDGATVSSSYTTNGGVSWSTPAVMAATGNLFSYGCSIGKFTATGTMYAVFANDAVSDRVEFWTSANGGQTWALQTTHAASVYGTPTFPSIGGAFNGYAAVERNNGMAVVRSVDDGATWNTISSVTTCGVGNDVRRVNGGPATGSAYGYVAALACANPDLLTWLFVTGNTGTPKTFVVEDNPLIGTIHYDAPGGVFMSSFQHGNGKEGFIYTADAGDTTTFLLLELSSQPAGGAFLVDGVFYSFMGDGVWTGSGGLAAQPTRPAGVSAFVRVASEPSVSQEAEIVLRWTISSNDPNRTAGAFNYYRITNGFTNNEVIDTVTAADANGVREMVFSQSGSGNFIYQVRAQNATSLEYSDTSCVITLNVEEQFDADSCGTNPPAITGTGGGTGEIFPGVGPESVAARTTLTVDAARWLFTLTSIIVLGFVGFRWGGHLLGSAGAGLGFAMSAAMGWLDFWIVVLVVVITLAVLFLPRRGGGGE